MPPVTPRTMRRPASTVTRAALLALAGGDGVAALDHRELDVHLDDLAVFLAVFLALDAVVGDLVGGDLLEPDRQRLAGHRRDLWRHHRPQAVAQMVEVRVDLAGAARRQ